MAHLMKLASGHLSKGTSGHLSKCCKCLDCDPPIPCKLYVTVARLGGIFAMFNGTHQLQWIRDCDWGILVGSGSLHLNIYSSAEGPRWGIIGTARGVGGCGFLFYGELRGCIVEGEYGNFGCGDFHCPGSCEASVGATCVVSYT